jgi:sulfur carrier protein ThiS
MGSLLPYGPPGQPGLIEISLKNGSAVREAIQSLKIPAEKVKLVLVNHTAAHLDQPLKEGDKVSLFPIEYPVFPDWKGFVKRH